jgi:hypothetical protein
MLEPLAQGADVNLALAVVRAELVRQQATRAQDERKRPAKGKPDPIDRRLKQVEDRLAKVNLAEPNEARDRLNLSIADLNKNIHEGVPDAPASHPAPSPASSSSSSSSSSARAPAQQPTIATVQADPLWAEAKKLGLFDHSQIRFWLGHDYLQGRGEAGIPDTNFKGVVVELQAKHMAEGRHEEAVTKGTVRVLTGLKVQEQTGEAVREIDVLAVRVMEDESLVPIELYEVKKAAAKPKSLKTDLDAKLKALRNAQANGHRVMCGGEDLVDQLVVDPAKVRLLTTGAADVYDVPLGAHVADRLYEFVNTNRYVLSRIFT